MATPPLPRVRWLSVAARAASTATVLDLPVPPLGAAIVMTFEALDWNGRANRASMALVERRRRTSSRAFSMRSVTRRKCAQAIRETAAQSARASLSVPDQSGADRRVHHATLFDFGLRPARCA